MKAVETLINRRKQPGIDLHLWVIISDPDIDSNNVVLVSITSQRSDKDQSCVITPTEHPFVQHDSVIYYAAAKVASNDDLDLLVSRNLMEKHHPVSADLLKRIRAGAWVSDDIPLGARQILLEQELLDF